MRNSTVMSAVPVTPPHPVRRTHASRPFGFCQELFLVGYEVSDLRRNLREARDLSRLARIGSTNAAAIFRRAIGAALPFDTRSRLIRSKSRRRTNTLTTAGDSPTLDLSAGPGR